MIVDRNQVGEGTLTEEEVIDVLKTCFDPEINIDIWTLKLIYEIKTVEPNKVFIKMTFTSPMCPFGPQIVEEIRYKLKSKNAEPDVEVVFSPPWEPNEEVKELLGLV